MATKKAELLSPGDEVQITSKISLTVSHLSHVPGYDRMITIHYTNGTSSMKPKNYRVTIVKS